jgi:hypothetical protein
MAEFWKQRLSNRVVSTLRQASGQRSFPGDIRQFATAYSCRGIVAGRFATAARLDQRRAIKRDALASIVAQ